MTEGLFAYQTRLQGLANKLGDDIAKAIGSTDRELVSLLLREISRLPKDKAILDRLIRPRLMAPLTWMSSSSLVAADYYPK